MLIKEPGHIYELDHVDGEGFETLTFVNREKGTEHSGTQVQEVLRALIDRAKHCDNCLRWPANDLIIYYYRQALVLHEARALERKAAKGLFEPEYVKVYGYDGHFALSASEGAFDHQLWLRRQNPDELVKMLVGVPCRPLQK